MIGQLTGNIIEKKPPVLLLDVNGVGYEVHAPMRTFYHFEQQTTAATLLTHLIVRDDQHTLYGFHDRRERSLFLRLIKVNGIGPKLALAILSGIEADHFVHCIHQQDPSTLIKIPGVGKKTAERMVMEMRDKLDEWQMSSTTPNTPNPTDQNTSDAVDALQALGFKPAEAKRAVTQVHQPEHSSEHLIRLALQQLAKH